MKTQRINFKLLIASILFVGLISSCKSDSTSTTPDEIPLGAFEGLVGTDENSGLYEELEGKSYFFTNEEENLHELALESNVVSTTSMTYIYAFIESENMLTPGTYPFNDIEDLSEFFDTGFSGLYVSPIVGNGRSYYSESGTMTIEIVTENGIKGALEATFFYLTPTGRDEYTRIYTTISAEFHAIYSDDSIYFIEDE